MNSTRLSIFFNETKQYLDKVTNEGENLPINWRKDTGAVIISLHAIARSPFKGIGNAEP